MLKKWFKEYININKRELVLLLTFFILGLVISVGIYMFMSLELKEIAINNAKEVFEISKNKDYIKTNIILNGVKADLILIVILILASVTLFGKAVVYGIFLLKGMAISMYSILLFNIFGPGWGILVTLLLVIFVNIIYIPAVMYLAICMLEINFNIFKAKINSNKLGYLSKALVVTLISFGLMFSSIVLEQLFSTIVLNIYTKL